MNKKTREDFISNYEGRKPTETYMYKNTKVNVYGKLDMKLFAQLVYNLHRKYNL